MNLVSALLLALTLITSSATAEAAKLSFESVDKVPGQRLISAIYFGGYVWLNYAALGIVRIDPEKMGIEKLTAYGDDAVSIMNGGDFLYLADTNTKAGSLDIYRLQDTDDVVPVAKMPLSLHERLLGLFDCQSTLCAVTNQHLYVQGPDGFKILQITSDTEFGFGGYTFGANTTDGSIYLGFDRGEWGGGLYKIDITSGKAEAIETKEADPCEGLLKTACSPVTFVQRDPADGKCVLAATGLAHFMTSGGYFQVCGDAIQPRFTHACDTKVSGGRTFHQENCYAVFSVSLTKDATWLSTSGGLIKLAPNGEPSTEKYPKLTDFHGLELSRDVPGLWIMTTDANAAYSVSGYTPVIVSVR